jgi:TRAP-type uncharacterized transport system substrate-binding protein
MFPRSSTSWRRRAATLVFAVAVFIAGAMYAKPPHDLTIETGPVGGSYYQAATQYQAILATQGIRLEIRPNPQSLEIVSDVANPQSGVDIGFVAQDVSALRDKAIYELGQIELQPLFIFANADLGRRITINDLRGRKIVLPPRDSATSSAAIRVFQLYDITPENSSFTFVPLDQAAQELQAGHFDAGVVMLAPANQTIRHLADDTGLHLVPMTEAKAVANHLPFLRPVVLPRGIYDIADAIPPNDTALVAATVGVVVRPGLHPYLIYALLEAMTKVHHGATFISNAGDFPTIAGSQLTIHPLAGEYFRSGVHWIYRELPPWPASIVDNYLLLVVGLYLLSRIFLGLHFVTDGVSALGTLAAQWLVSAIVRSAARRGHLSRPQRMLLSSAKRILRITTPAHRADGRFTPGPEPGGRTGV